MTKQIIVELSAKVGPVGTVPTEIEVRTDGSLDKLDQTLLLFQD